MSQNYFIFTKDVYKKEVKTQCKSCSPSTTRQRSNSDVADNSNITKTQISSLSFPLSIDALLKVDKYFIY